MEAKTKIILLGTYKKMYEAMKNSAEKKRIEKLIKELEDESKSDQKTMEGKGGGTCSAKESRQNSEGSRC